MEDKDYVFDLNSTPETWDPKKLIHMMQNQTMIPLDPTKTINTIPSVEGYGQGIWSQINSTTYSPTRTVIERLESLELTNRLLKLEILVLKGKFTEEEADNIKAMLTSNDEASVTLAETILENS